MLNKIKQLLSEVTKSPEQSLDFGPDDYRLATAALLFHVVAIDGDIDYNEMQTLYQVLKDSYELSEEDTEKLIEMARERDDEAVDLYGFTSVLKRQLNKEDRLKIIKMMWEIVFADGTVHEFEDNTIWRVAELLGISSRERLELKHEVSESSGPESDDLD